MELTFVNKVTFGEYYIGNVMCILLRVYPNIAEPPYLRYEGKDRSASNKSYGVLSQESTGLTQTAVDPARNYKRESQAIKDFIHKVPLNADLNSICHLLTLAAAHHILHVSRVRVSDNLQRESHKH